MTAINVQSVVNAARKLSPIEQLEVIQALSEALQQFVAKSPAFTDTTTSHLPDYVRRAPPITNLEFLAADFWPEDESADDINAFVRKQRLSERHSNIPDGEEL
jgi:hypothetical protein